MLPPQLRPGQPRLGPGYARAIAFTRIPVGAAVSSVSQQRDCSWFSKARTGNWDSHLDPQYQQFQRRRQVRTRAALRNALRRMNQWDLPSPMLRPCSIRNASHWSKSSGRRWQDAAKDATKDRAQSDAGDYELSSGEKRWKEKMEAMKGYLDTDSYRAIFGNRVDPFWSPAAWKPLMPSWMAALEDSSTKATQNADLQAAGSAQSSSPSGGAHTKSPSSETKHRRPRQRSETSSFTARSSQKAGEKPVVEASASSWDPDSNVTKHLKYDPISNRMVSADTPDRQSSIMDQFIGKLQSSKQYLEEAAGIQSKDTTTAHADRPKSAELPESDIDVLTADNVRAAMGKVKQSRKMSAGVEEAQMKAVNQDFITHLESLSREIDEAQEGVNEAEAKALARLQTSLDRVNARKYAAAGSDVPAGPRRNLMGSAPVSIERDDYSNTPMGMQTAFVEEKHAIEAGLRVPLEKEITAAEHEDANPDDGYSVESIGLQTSFTHEQEEAALDETHSFEAELRDASTSLQRAERAIEDEYPQNAIGLQTSFALENEAASKDVKLSFESQLKEASMSLRKAELAFDDEYPQSPIGLQTSYVQEVDAAVGDVRLSFESQLKEASMALQKAERALDDEYPKSAIGLQTSFAQETEAAAQGRKQSFEAQLKDASVALRRAERALEDEYPKIASGLQTSFAQERQAALRDNTQSFEQQLRDASSALQRAERALEDEYPKNAIGLQTSFAQERDAAAIDIKQSFEQQLKDANQAVLEAQKGLTPQPEDGYGKAPIGLETSYVKESQDCAKGTRKPLEKEFTDSL